MIIIIITIVMIIMIMIMIIIITIKKENRPVTYAFSTLGELNLTPRLNVLRLKDIYFNNIFFGYVCRADINNCATNWQRTFEYTDN